MTVQSLGDNGAVVSQLVILALPKKPKKRTKPGKDQRARRVETRRLFHLPMDASYNA